MRLFQNFAGLVEQLAGGFDFRAGNVLRGLAGNEVFDGNAEGGRDPDGFRGLREDFPGAPVPEGLIFHIGRFCKRFLCHFSFFYESVYAIPETCRHMTRINVFLLKINSILLDICSYTTILDYRNAVK